MKKIKAYIKRPDEAIGHSTWISNTLENLQNIVGGYIETVSFGDLIIICNEEGRILGMPHNCTIHNVDFCGDIIAVGIDEDDFGDVPISFDEWKEVING